MVRVRPAGRRGERGQGMIEYALIVGLISIFVIVAILTLFDFGAQNLLGDLEGIEANAKVTLRNHMLNQVGGPTSQAQEDYLSGAYSPDAGDDIPSYY